MTCVVCLNLKDATSKSRVGPSHRSERMILFVFLIGVKRSMRWVETNFLLAECSIIPPASKAHKKIVRDMERRLPSKTGLLDMGLKIVAKYCTAQLTG